jgi:hypothetical protein
MSLARACTSSLSCGNEYGWPGCGNGSKVSMSAYNPSTEQSNAPLDAMALITPNKKKKKKKKKKKFEAGLFESKIRIRYACVHLGGLQRRYLALTRSSRRT